MSLLDPTDSDFINEWEGYLKYCEDAGLWVPDTLRREIDNFILHPHDNLHSNPPNNVDMGDNTTNGGSLPQNLIKKHSS